MGRADSSRTMLAQLRGWLRGLWAGHQLQVRPKDDMVVTEEKQSGAPVMADTELKEMEGRAYAIYLWYRVPVETRWPVVRDRREIGELVENAFWERMGQSTDRPWGKAEIELGRQVQQSRGQILQLFSRMEQVEAHVDRLRREKKEVLLLSYSIEEFEVIRRGLTDLQESCENKDRVLFQISEIETLLGRVEEKARSLGRKYELRLSRCLRDVCWVNEPHKLTPVQIKYFCAALKVLIEGWGKLTREKVNWTARTLVEAGLSVLPVTDKVAAELKGADA